MTSVKGPSMTRRLSLMTRILTLSIPGDLFEAMDVIMRLTCSQVTEEN